MNLYVIFILVSLSLHRYDAQSICSGQDFVLDHINVSSILSQLQDYFNNCEYVYGNLEISFPQLTYIPVQFSSIFSSIREIQGYLLLENIRTETLNLSNLLIIRGESNFTIGNTQNALVLKNTQINTLLLINLKEITNFGIIIYNENGTNISSACNLHGINWVDIANTSNVYLSPNCPPQNCTGCFPSYCWTENICQMLTLVNCTSCSGGRCVTSNPSECCDVNLCSAGCTTSTDCNTCSGCRRFDSGSVTCLQISGCIPIDPLRLYPFLTPPNLSASCKPPLIVFLSGGFEFCSQQCPNTNDDGCIEIGTSLLQCRVCGSTENICTPYPLSQPQLPALNVPSIPKAPCTIDTINSIVLGQESFDPSNPITPSLLNVFRNLTVISDYLVIRDFPSYYGETFSFLSRLERIEGDTLYMGRYALYISGNSFRQIDLRNLNNIIKGDVLIENNTNLCYLPTMAGLQTLTDPSYEIQIQSANCPCDSLCQTDMGCWGPSNAQCIQCDIVEIDDTCEANCVSRQNTFISIPSRECMPCSPVCNNCTISELNCVQCRNVSFGGMCLASCPQNTFQNGTQCVSCNSNCDLDSVGADGSICAGPTDNLGSNGCNKCLLNQPQPLSSSSNYTCVSMCANSNQSTDPILGPVCQPCDPACTRCSGQMVENCDTDACSFFLEDASRCVLACPNETHFIPEPKICTSCDDNCIGCTGVTNQDCINCRVFKRRSECVSNCPSDEFSNSSSECEACSQLCSRCTGTRDNCTGCALAELIKNGTSTCLNECPPGYYRAANLTCYLCNRECFNCSGPLDTQCDGCRNFELLPGGQCVRVCPDIAEINNATKTCTLTTSLNAGVIAGISVGGFIFFLLVLAVVIALVVGGIYGRKYKKKRREIEQGTLLPMREQGNIQRAIEGLPEFTLLGFNYKRLADATPAVYPLHVIDNNALEIRKLLGRGFYGSVYAGQYNQNSENSFPVAVKNLDNNGLKRDFENVISNTMQDISVLMHPSLIQVFGYNSSNSSPFIVTQLLIGPSLYTLFSKYPGCIDENKIFKYIVQVGDGMMYIEKQGFVYGLVTARNVILVNQDRIKLTDFFIYRFSDPIPEKSNLPIQERWMSPELALTHNPTSKSDVWGFGVLFWELLSFAQVPFDTVPDDAVVEVLQQGQRLPQPNVCSVDLYGYLLQCFLFDPSGRPKFEKLQNELVEMSKCPQKYISIQDTLLATNTYQMGHTLMSENTNLVISNANVNTNTLTQQDISPDDLGLGEYVDDEEVNRRIDSELIASTAQQATIEDLGLGEYVDEEQVDKLIDAESSEKLISDETEYGEINQASTVGANAVNEYEPVNPSDPSLQFPNFISIQPINDKNVNLPTSSLDFPADEVPYENPTFISPNASLSSAYETAANQNGKT